MQYLGKTYTNNSFVVFLKFKFNWMGTLYLSGKFMLWRTTKQKCVCESSELRIYIINVINLKHDSGKPGSCQNLFINLWPLIALGKNKLIAFSAIPPGEGHSVLFWFFFIFKSCLTVLHHSVWEFSNVFVTVLISLFAILSLNFQWRVWPKWFTAYHGGYLAFLVSSYQI